MSVQFCVVSLQCLASLRAHPAAQAAKEDKEGAQIEKCKQMSKQSVWRMKSKFKAVIHLWIFNFLSVSTPSVYRFFVHFLSLSFFVSKFQHYILFYVKTQHSYLYFCHLTNFFFVTLKICSCNYFITFFNRNLWRQSAWKCI